MLFKCFGRDFQIKNAPSCEEAFFDFLKGAAASVICQPVLACVVGIIVAAAGKVAQIDRPVVAVVAAAAAATAVAARLPTAFKTVAPVSAVAARRPAAFKTVTPLSVVPAGGARVCEEVVDCV